MKETDPKDTLGSVFFLSRGILSLALAFYPGSGKGD